MAQQATAYGFENGDAWAFGPASRATKPKAVRQPEPEPDVEPLFDPVVESVPVAEPAAGNGHVDWAAEYAKPAVLVADYAQPAVLMADYAEPAVFNGQGPEPAELLAHPSEPATAQRSMWDELPSERPRRSRRYVGKHRA
jgi:hypothetical protein